MIQFRSDVLIAHVLYRIQTDMIDLVREGEFSEDEIRNIFRGWHDRLEISQAAIFTEPVPDDEAKYLKEKSE